jgi:protein-L-isoaspartate(D-aspartate) O-methyltransferase
MSKPVRVLLLWPGADAATSGNFGVPQLVLLGTNAHAKTGATIDIRDLELERALGKGEVSLPKLLAGDDGRGYDIVALSVYSSFDHLKCSAIAEIARELSPECVIMVGGYHPSARPFDYIYDGSVFDVCVVGEGERPLVNVIESVEGGAPLRGVVLGPDAIDDLDELPPSDWSLLARYRQIAPKVASQAQVYLSRGCPFDCAFCMERAKREVSWRPLSVERAIGEIESLHRFLDLRGWTLYFGDALFGMRKSWRREFLERLARAAIPVEKYWLLIRVDLIEDEDLRLFGAANCGLGFGLESGDPGQLAIIRKSGRLDTYLDRMEDIAEKARAYQVPWGANVICGHPGETRASLERSAAYLAKLFLRTGGTTGFLSVDPFRLYPGSPIDAERSHWEQTYGTRFHRPSWWQDGDPEFLAEWVDPSAELTYLERERLQHELLTPILAQIEGNFAYQGPAREYFLRAVREQVAFCRPHNRLHYLGRYFAWQGYLGRRAKSERERREYEPLRELCLAERKRRLEQIGTLAEIHGPVANYPVLAAIEAVPRERFVPYDEVTASVRDIALALDDSGLATISAMHAYARSFTLLEVGPGDRVLDLGAGTGYGSALLARLVGDAGAVLAIEIDAALVQRGRELLAELGATTVRWLCGDARAADEWEVDAASHAKVTVGFALDDVPRTWLSCFCVGTVIVAPLRDDEDGQVRLSRLVHRGDHFEIERFEAVAYVPTRVPLRPTPTPTPEPVIPAVRLPVMR